EHRVELPPPQLRREIRALLAVAGDVLDALPPLRARVAPRVDGDLIAALQQALHGNAPHVARAADDEYFHGDAFLNMVQRPLIEIHGKAIGRKAAEALGAEDKLHEPALRDLPRLPAV